MLVVVGVAGGATLVAVATGSDDRYCVDAASRSDKVVDRLDAIGSATASAEVPWAGHAGARAQESIDAYASAWRAAWLESCAAQAEGELRRPWGEDIRRQCLDERFAILDVVSVALAEGVDPDRALHAATELPRLEDCNDPAHLSARTPLPADETTRGAIEIVRRDLAAIQIEREAIEAAAATSDLVDRAADLGYAPLHIEALRVFGQRQLEAGKLSAGLHNVQQSVLLAREHADHTAAVDALLLLAQYDGRAAATQRLREAEAFLPGATRAGYREAQLRLTEGTLHAAAGAPDEARIALQRARALFDVHAPEALPLVGQTHHLLAQLTEGEASKRHEDLARKNWTTHYGPDHPRLAELD